MEAPRSAVWETGSVQQTVNGQRSGFGSNIICVLATPGLQPGDDLFTCSYIGWIPNRHNPWCVPLLWCAEWLSEAENVTPFQSGMAFWCMFAIISRALHKKTRFWSNDTVQIGCLAKKVDCSETDRVNVGYHHVKLLAPDSLTAEILNGILLYHNKKKNKNL